jgi:hypothetical protein
MAQNSVMRRVNISHINGEKFHKQLHLLSLASAEAQDSVVRAIMHFKGKTSFLTPASSPTIYPMKMKISTVYNVWKVNKCAKFRQVTYRCSVHTHT